MVYIYIYMLHFYFWDKLSLVSISIKAYLQRTETILAILSRKGFNTWN